MRCSVDKVRSSPYFSGVSDTTTDKRPTSNRSTSRGALAREAMLDAAEEIGCTAGLGAITLTAVQQHAGQANKSAAAYHFGSRTGLLQAVVGRRMGPIDAHRTRLLDACDPENLAGLVEALVRPFAEATVLAPDSRWARFIAQVFIDPALSELAFGHDQAQSLRRVQALLADLLTPRLGEATTTLRIIAVTGSLTTTLALLETRPDLPVTPALVDDLVATSVASLNAPTP